MSQWWMPQERHEWSQRAVLMAQDDADGRAEAYELAQLPAMDACGECGEPIDAGYHVDGQWFHGACLDAREDHPGYDADGTWNGDDPRSDIPPEYAEE